jgi:hypothetical protein
MDPVSISEQVMTRDQFDTLHDTIGTNLHLVPYCHPDSPSWVRYVGDGMLVLLCAHCQMPYLAIALAVTIETVP